MNSYILSPKIKQIRNIEYQKKIGKIFVLIQIVNKYDQGKQHNETQGEGTEYILIFRLLKILKCYGRKSTDIKKRQAIDNGI